MDDWHGMSWPFTFFINFLKLSPDLAQPTVDRMTPSYFPFLSFVTGPSRPTFGTCFSLSPPLAACLPVDQCLTVFFPLSLFFCSLSNVAQQQGELGMLHLVWDKDQVEDPKELLDVGNNVEFVVRFDRAAGKLMAGLITKR
jgi:hypothetical protein